MIRSFWNRHAELTIPLHVRRPTLSLLTLFFSALPVRASVPQAEERGRVRWNVFDQGAGWIPDDVAVGDDGAAVFAGLFHNQPSLRLYPGGSSTPVFVTLPEIGIQTLQTQVAIADSAPVAASLTTHQTSSVPDDPDIVAVLRAYDLVGDGQPLWEHVLPESDYNTELGVAISDEGGVILTWWSVESLGGMLVTAWDAGGELVSRGVVSGAGGILWPEEAALSRDGSVVLFSLPLLGEAVIYDVRSGSVKASVPDNGIFSGHALSGDGSRFAGVEWQIELGYRLSVFELDARGEPVEIFERIYPDSVRVPVVALDLDGSRLAYSVQEINPSDAFTVVLYDLDSGNELFAKTFAAPGTSSQLWNSALQLDDTGETLACANWGDSLNATPEVLALDDRGTVLVGVDARGSGMRIDLSRDGELLFAGCKATHANVFGSGGDLYMVETRAQQLRIEGEPRLGGTLELSVHADPTFDRMILVVSGELTSEPKGDLRLDFSSGRRVIGTFPLDGGELTTRFPVPSTMELAGQAAHFQAMLLDDDLGGYRLTNKVSLRFLP